ncbi:flavin-containing monooxygenase [Amycolatopsis sp. VS8301801F10]|uniref:flavin-containing monooxygenase n=1 Tax=Amycolatopsis sp. VS8301801F10 TaxID=2652442 RepID=UPI0038FD1115
MQAQVDVAVIGAGQCGLAVGRQLKMRNSDFVLIDRCARVGDSWRRFMDSLRLVTPAGVSALTGLAFPAPARAFPGKLELADYLENYADAFSLPCELNVEVRRVRTIDGRFTIDLSPTGSDKGGHEEQSLVANSVVVATGFLHELRIPNFAEELDPTINQLTMSDYLAPDQVSGPVLVVGAGNSGVQIAHDLAPAHEVWLSGPNPGHFLFDLSNPTLWNIAHRLFTPRNPVGRRFIAMIQRKEPPVIKISEKRLRQMGVIRLPKVSGTENGYPVLADGHTVRPATLVWSTGFRSDFSWIHLPVFDAVTGLPRHTRGITEIEGLYFMGLPFQYGFTSHFIRGVDRDAANIVEHLAHHRLANAETTLSDRSDHPQ